MRPPLPLPEPPDAVRLAAAARRHEAPGGERGALWHEWGAGRPLVLLHGGFGSWTHWVANIDRLSARRRVLAADLPGFGGSPAPAPGTGVRDMARILRRGLAALAPEGCDIAAFSFSGLVAAHLASAEGPARIGRLVLVGPARFGGWGSIRDSLRSWRRAETAEAEIEAHRENLARLMLHDPARITPELTALQAANARAARLRVTQVPDLGPVEDALARNAVPLAGIWGEHDPLAGDLSLARDSLRRLDPAAPFHVVQGAGHWVQFEAPDRFADLLESILAPERTGAR